MNKIVTMSAAAALALTLAACNKADTAANDTANAAVTDVSNGEDGAGSLNDSTFDSVGEANAANLSDNVTADDAVDNASGNAANAN